MGVALRKILNWTEWSMYIGRNASFDLTVTDIKSHNFPSPVTDTHTHTHKQHTHTHARIRPHTLTHSSWLSQSADSVQRSGSWRQAIRLRGRAWEAGGWGGKRATGNATTRAMIAANKTGQPKNDCRNRDITALSCRLSSIIAHNGLFISIDSHTCTIPTQSVLWNWQKLY